MGCDIHAFFEIKVDGKWLFYAPFRITRDYDLFSRLADVRNDVPGGEDYIEPISGPRGIPGDASEMYRLHVKVDEGDGHSHSWITSSEYVEVAERFPKLFKHDSANYFREVFLFGNSFYDFFKYREDFPDFVEDFRMVFYFDN